MDGKRSDADDAADAAEKGHELSEETSRKVATDIGFESRHLVITTHFKDVPDNDIPEENRSKKQDLTWFCKVCDMKIMEEKIIHFRTSEHKEKKKWQRPYCDVCDLWFRHPRQLVQHVKAPKHKSMAQTFENDEETNSIQSTLNNTETSADKEIKTEVVEKVTNADKSDSSDGTKRKTSVDTEEPEESVKLDIPHIIPVTGYYCDACCDFFFDEGSTLNHIKTESHRVKVKNGSSKASEANKTSAPKAAKRKCKPINGATPKPAKIPNKTSTKPLDWNFVIPKRK
uniref:C2H2-type domain-containing protein n=1 Tax=Ciona savignyi TaxID=51511 RepID=H2YU95_CIOSA